MAEAPGDSGRTIRVLIADDHGVLRAGLRRILELEPDLVVVGDAGDGEEALRLARELRPDVVLMDISMPGLNGLEATRLLRRELPSVRVLVLTIHADDQFVVEMVRAGAAGYIVKDAEPGSVVRAIRRVAGGEVVIPENLVGSLVRALRHSGPSSTAPPERPTEPSAAAHESAAAAYAAVPAPIDAEPDIAPAPAGVPAAVAGPASPAGPAVAAAPARRADVARRLWPELTAREAEVLALVAQGKTNQQIAQILVVSEKTVKNHITSILRKLRLKDRTQAAVWAIRSGWMP